MLAVQESAAAWDLRAAWALRCAVVLALDPRIAAHARVAGWVDHVSPTDAFAVLELVDGEGMTVPCVAVLSVRAPHFHEPADAEIRMAPRRPRRTTVLDVYPGQLALFEDADGQGRLEL